MPYLQLWSNKMGHVNSLPLITWQLLNVWSRNRVVHYNHFHRSLRVVSRIYGVSKSSLQRRVKHSPSFKKSRRKTCITDEVRKCIILQLKNNPFITIDDLANKIAIDCNIKRSRRTVNRYVKSQGYSFKSAFRMVNIGWYEVKSGHLGVP